MYNKLYKNLFGKPLIYLISPPKIDIKTFPLVLSKVLDTGMVSIFQLRLKNYKDKELIKITYLLNKICTQKDVFLFLMIELKLLKN